MIQSGHYCCLPLDLPQAETNGYECSRFVRRQPAFDSFNQDRAHLESRMYGRYLRFLRPLWTRTRLGLNPPRSVGKHNNKTGEKQNVNKKGNDDRKRINNRKPTFVDTTGTWWRFRGMWVSTTQLNRRIQELFRKGEIGDKRRVIGHQRH